MKDDSPEVCLELAAPQNSEFRLPGKWGAGVGNCLGLDTGNQIISHLDKQGTQHKIKGAKMYTKSGAVAIEQRSKAFALSVADLGWIPCTLYGPYTLRNDS